MRDLWSAFTLQNHEYRQLNERRYSGDDGGVGIMCQSVNFLPCGQLTFCVFLFTVVNNFFENNEGNSVLSDISEE